jgi:hypothetical protein
VIEVESSIVIRTSREAVWRHLTRVGDWYRWYPGLHGVSTEDSLSRIDQSWRATGQMGRMLYRSNQRVTEYRLLSELVIYGDRRPWIRSCRMCFRLEPDGANCRLRVIMIAQPGLWLFGRLILSRTLERRLQTEADALADRLRRYVERTMPYH